MLRLLIAFAFAVVAPTPSWVYDTMAATDGASELPADIAGLIAQITSQSARDADVSALIDDFRARQSRTDAELLLQVALTYGGVTEYRTDPRSEAGKRAIISRLLTTTPSDDILAVITPAYEAAPNKEARRGLRHVMDAVAYSEGRVAPDVEVFRRPLEEYRAAPPYSLVRYVYGLDPIAARNLMASVFGVNADFFESMSANTVDNLEAIAARAEWWDQLFVAEWLAINPSLRSAALIQVLRASEFPVVRDAAEALASHDH